MQKQDIIEFFEHADVPLKQYMKDSIEENLEYYIFTGQCRICNYYSILITPVVSNNECDNCGNMTIDPIDEDDCYLNSQLQPFFVE